MSKGKDLYWCVSVDAAKGKEDAVFQKLSQIGGDVASCARFPVPPLRVGTLDMLMSLSDSLVKTDHTVENITKKIGQYLTALRDTLNEGRSSHARADLTVSVQHDDGRTLTLGDDQYLQKFTWIERRFPKKMPCDALATRLAEAVSYVDEQFRTATSEYSMAAQKVVQLDRNKAGNLAVKDLANFVTPDMIVESDTFSTLFVVVPLQSAAKWASEYGSLVTFSKRSNSAPVTAAVPRSSIEIARDNEFTLNRVVVLKVCEDEFKKQVRAKLKFIVREYKPQAQEEDADAEASYEALKADLSKKQNRLFVNCKVWFSEVFSAWVHLRAIRVHVESILRYGLPPHFQSVIFHLNKASNDKKLRKALDEAFSSSMSSTSAGEDDMGALAGMAEAFYPYVFFEFDLEFTKD